jgi:hypothetical protein
LSNPILQAQPPLEFIPPAFDPIVYRVTQLLLPAWLRWQVEIQDIQVSNSEGLVDLYRQFQAGKIRFMMAFRHPSVDDPMCLYHLLSRSVPQTARQQNIPLNAPIHSHFIYDRGIPLWAGKPVGWLYSRLGGTPIRRGKVDLMGLRSIRQLFVEGRFPLAAAPEGATNGQNEIVSPIEPGIAQFGFWCIEDLLKAGRTEQVLIVPIGIQYRYLTTPWSTLEQLLTQMEADCGLPAYPSAAAETAATEIGQIPLAGQQQMLYGRLLRLGEHLLSLMEQFYVKFYHQSLKRPATPEPASTAAIEPTMAQPEVPTFANQQISNRLQALLNTALTVAEQYFGIPPKGTLTDRCRRLEQAGWDWIYREDFKQIEALSPVERGLADRIAEEANLRLWHMRVVESFVSVTGHYVIEKPTIDRFAETLLLLWDTVSRVKGKPTFPRPQLGPRRVQITIGEPISVSDRWPDYKANRRQAVATLTQELQTALEEMIS